MNRRTKLIVAAVAAPVLIVGGAVTAYAAGGTGCATLTYPLCARSVAKTQVVDHSLDEQEFTPGVVAKLNKVGTQGPAGKDGAPGADGKAGADGKPGVSGLHADAPYGANLPGQDSSSTTVPAGETAVIWTACAPGEAALGGGYRIGDLANESFATGKDVAYPDLQVIASEPAYYNDGKLVNGSDAAPVNANLSFMPNAWAVTVHNDGKTDSAARAWANCALVGK